ncbi:hypothetical protein [Streptomyces sp. NPDC058045]|uniref:hypothetical protein n=1 Tax=Streptomyces sp. NPDC058045 TaxID=3346311 RepID=UPI0036E8D2EC
MRARDMAAALGERIALAVVSAPSCAHEVLDPIAEIAAEADRRGVLCHADARIGGCYLGHLRLGLHKYAYTPKGASVLLRDAEPRRHGWFAYTSWPGYPVVNALQGTKPAAPLAAAWAVSEQIGTAGYRDLARRAQRVVRVLAEGIGAVQGLRVVGEPAASLLALASDDPGLDVLVLADKLRAARG